MKLPVTKSHLGRRVLPCEGSMIVQPILDEAVMREMRKAPIGDEDQQWAVARKNDVFCARKSGGASRVDQRLQTRSEAAGPRNQHRSEERSVGKAWEGPCGDWGAPNI